MRNMKNALNIILCLLLSLSLVLTIDNKVSANENKSCSMEYDNEDALREIDFSLSENNVDSIGLMSTSGTNTITRHKKAGSFGDVYLMATFHWWKDSWISRPER